MKKTLRLPQRIYTSSILKDLQNKMVFLAGPRQVGKTTIATSLISNYKDNHPAYYNWDNDFHRKIIQRQDWSKEEPLIVFDEIHKRKGWQSFIKGIWDTWKNTQKFMVTGSARLDIFRKGGDSLLGRYHYYRIHPYTLSELGISEKNLELLFRFGGFPEPLLLKDETEHRRWQIQRISKLIRIDLRDLEQVSDLNKVELLADALPARVGNLLSFKSLAEDLEVSDKTVKRWIQILDSLYYCYLISPFGAPKIKAIKKTQKLYLWDWSQVQDAGARFENMVASHLLKLCDYWLDVKGYKSELRYIRSETGKEVDFIVIKDKKPLFAVECKLNDLSPSANIIEFKKLKIPKWYQVHMGTAYKVVQPDFAIMSFERFCKEIEAV